MAKVFTIYSGEAVFANGKPLFRCEGVLNAPFHVEIKPLTTNPRRVDINCDRSIQVDDETVQLKCGEPLLLDPDYSVMVTRIFNYDKPYCRISIRCQPHVELTKRRIP